MKINLHISLFLSFSLFSCLDNNQFFCLQEGSENEEEEREEEEEENTDYLTDSNKENETDEENNVFM